VTLTPEEITMDRRSFLECMTWAGTGLVWAVGGGTTSASILGRPRPAGAASGFTFVQISDTHVGYKGPANPDAMASLAATINRINALPQAPAFVLHTGDLTHAQKAGAFDTLTESLQALHTRDVFYVPGEHDVYADGGKEFLSRYGHGTVGGGWRSFDHGGVHFIGLVNVLDYKADGLGRLGAEQIEWLGRDLAGLSASTPIVVYAHIPLWAVYPEWGWVTGDAEQALAALRRFGSVTVLNGHIHQVLQKTEGTVRFHTARSTAFPQPAPGAAASPGPLKVAEGQVGRMLGLREVRYVESAGPLAVVDTALDG
jgi:3',5'-cyclic AMP phosphodiesterase CpdA